jgi:4a-hydroxytetrahydrobiopterin dehydratase
MSDLADKACVPCRGDVPPLRGKELEELERQLPDWEVVEGHHLRREFRFRNFREALDFVNRVGELAEEQGHHPDVEFGWGRAAITIFTHKIDGLTESDFVLAAKVDRLYAA